MYLGLKAVITKSFARIHHANLVNFGILPLVFDNPSDLDTLSQGDVLRLSSVRKILKTGGKLHVENVRKKQNYSVSYNLSPRQVEVVLAGGLLNYTRKQKA